MHRYQWNASLEARLQQATARMRQLRQSTLPAAAVQSVRHWFRVHHTYHSNAIEGNRLTLPETRAVLEDGITIQGKSLKDHLEAVNLAQALDFIESLAKAETPLGEQDVRAIHTIVLRGIDPEKAGAYRHINVRISGTEHIPPEALHVPEHMRAFGEWLAREKPEHPIVVSAIAHAWFETLHPFEDGNGRTGRLLANLLIMRQGYPAMVLPVQERARYYAALDTSHSGDLSPMVELTLDCVEKSLTEYERAAREAFEVQEPAIEYLSERLRPAKEAEAPPEFLRWKLAIEQFHGAVRHMAEQINAQLSQHQREAALVVSDLPSINQNLWRLASRRWISLFRCQGWTQSGMVMATVDAYPAVEPWWTSKQPYLRLNIRDEPRQSPERFFAAMPDDHLFTALYARDAGRPALAPEQLAPGSGEKFVPSPDLVSAVSAAGVIAKLLLDATAKWLPRSLVLPSDVTVKEKVSAQQIAVDIWKHLVENYLT